MNRKARKTAQSRCRDTFRIKFGEGRTDGRVEGRKARQIGSIPGNPFPSRIETGQPH
jgi:hypothetical protein